MSEKKPESRADVERRIARSNAEIARLREKHRADVAKWLEELRKLTAQIDAAPAEAQR